MRRKAIDVDLSAVKELDSTNTVELGFKQHPRITSESEITFKQLPTPLSIQTSKDLIAAVKTLAPRDYHKLLRAINIPFTVPGQEMPSVRRRDKIFFTYNEFWQLIELLDPEGKILVLSKSIKNSQDLIVALKNLSLEDAHKLLNTEKIQFPTLILNTLPKEMKGKLFFAYNAFWDLIKSLEAIKQMLVLLHTADLGLAIDVLFDVPLTLIEDQEFTTLIASIKMILPKLFSLDKLEKIVYRLQANRGEELIRAYIRNMQKITAQLCIDYINSRKLFVYSPEATEEFQTLLNLTLLELLCQASVEEVKKVLITLFDSEDIDDSKLYLHLTKKLNYSLIDRLALNDSKFWSEQCVIGGTERRGYKIPEKVARLMDYAQAHKNDSYDHFLEGLDKIRKSGFSWASIFGFFRREATEYVYNPKNSLHTIAQDFITKFYK